jgi:hypothetical protein
VNAWRRQDVAAGGPDIEAGSELARRIADRRGWHSEVNMPATRGNDFDCGRQRAMLSLEPAQLGFGIDTVDVEDENAGGCARRNADIELWV